MKYNLIDNKFLKGESSDQMVDLTSKCYRFPDEYAIRDIFLVTEPYVMRPDLISHLYFKSTDYADLICKTNGIRDMLSINLYDILIIFDKETLNKCINTEQDINKVEIDQLNQVAKQYNDSTKLSKKDQERIEYLKYRNNKRSNANNVLVPPRINKTGEMPFRIDDNGFINFGK